ncbi:hypothetical protein F4780DRAFT_783270 [Xylariomycetidae sp. FL0641]|nr:hypothetical protein F4780DRAFT_783270 [Xylariomycetidae sp. FL0641]
MLTDLLLCILPVGMVWGVQTTRIRKFQIVMLFGVRIAVPIAVVISLTYTQWLFQDQASNFTWLAVAPTIWLQVSVGLSIITGSIPNMKGFFDSFLGNTMRLAVDAPYQLTQMDNGTGLEESAQNEGPGVLWESERQQKQGGGRQRKRQESD